MKIESKHLFLIALIAFVSYLFLNSSLFKTLTTFESFQNNERDELEKKILDHPDLENAHGSAPAGVNALPGDIQFKLNTLSEYVNPMYRDGNPQNTNNLLKKQP
jgi:hypothetical protein